MQTFDCYFWSRLCLEAQAGEYILGLSFRILEFDICLVLAAWNLNLS